METSIGDLGAGSISDAAAGQVATGEFGTKFYRYYFVG
jgi:hypothetical protein